jgi:hypothetical protein
MALSIAWRRSTSTPRAKCRSPKCASRTLR